MGISMRVSMSICVCVLSFLPLIRYVVLGGRGVVAIHTENTEKEKKWKKKVSEVKKVKWNEG